MTEATWEKLEGDQIAPHVQLRKLLSSDEKRAVFSGNYTDAAAEVLDLRIELFDEGQRSPDERVSRFLEAKYFEHPNLLRCFDAGAVTSSGSTLTYAITEVTDAWRSRTLSAWNALSFARQVLSGLEYLHRKELVYCVLSPHTVGRVGTEWKLSDFSELRVAGVDTSEEALSLARASETSPPEAAEGMITPAWDVWSFGQTLWKLLGNDKAHQADPLRPVFLACININPSSRPTVSQLSELLEEKRRRDGEAGVSAAARA